MHGMESREPTQTRLRPNWAAAGALLLPDRRKQQTVRRNHSFNHRGAVQVAKALLIALLPVFCAAMDEEPWAGAVTPERVRLAAKRDGAAVVLEGLGRDTRTWTSLLEGIGSGRDAWLEALRPLMARASRRDAESLRMALSEALTRNAGGVLRQFSAEDACSSWGLGERRDTSYNVPEARRHIQSVLDSVRAVADSPLRSKRDECIERLLRLAKDPFSSVPWQEPVSPDTILIAVQKSGAKRIVEAFGEGAWDTLVQGVGSGNQAWLEVAARLQPAVDGEAGATLHMALGDALVRNPSGVLRRFGPEHACYPTGLYELGEQASSASLPLERAREQLAALSRVTGEALKAKVTECAKRIRAQQELLAQRLVQ